MPFAPDSINRIKGVPFQGFGSNWTTGNIFFVDSGSSQASDDVATNGGSPDKPFATIDYAIGCCTASNGDIIYVMPGHAETIAGASGIALDVVGVSIVGLGNPGNRPVLTYSATASTLVVSAASCRVQNIGFLSAIDSLVGFVIVSANNFTIEDCRFITSNTKEAGCFINLTTTYDYLTVRRCRFIQPTDPNFTSAAANTGAIFLVDSEYVTIEDCQFVGNFETAFIHNRTTAAGQLWGRRNYGYQALANGKIGILVAGATGGDTKSLYINPNATDVTTAQLWGTESTAFFMDSYFGNDSATGDMGAVKVTAAS